MTEHSTQTNVLNWRDVPVFKWHADSCSGETWDIQISAKGYFYVANHPDTFQCLEAAKQWCEERETELIAAQPKRRLAKLYRNRATGTYYADLAEDGCRTGPWDCLGSAWITEGEFADERA